MRDRKYSYELHKRINAQIPERIALAMCHCGWNAFGIYELVKNEIKNERKQKANEHPEEGGDGI